MWDRLGLEPVGVARSQTADRFAVGDPSCTGREPGVELLHVVTVNVEPRQDTRDTAVEAPLVVGVLAEMLNDLRARDDDRFFTKRSQERGKS